VKIGEALQSLTTGATSKGERRLAAAVRVRDSGLQYPDKRSAHDPLRNEPRLQAIERELKFPN
jgi:hypothetical protein